MAVAQVVEQLLVGMVVRVAVLVALDQHQEGLLHQAKGLLALQKLRGLVVLAVAVRVALVELLMARVVHMVVV
jgi:hypothetical protein